MRSNTNIEYACDTHILRVWWLSPTNIFYLVALWEILKEAVLGRLRLQLRNNGPYGLSLSQHWAMTLKMWSLFIPCSEVFDVVRVHYRWWSTTVRLSYWTTLSPRSVAWWRRLKSRTPWTPQPFNISGYGLWPVVLSSSRRVSSVGVFIV